MKITKHMKMRMNQRAIKQDLVELVLNYGEPLPDGKIVLSKQAAKVMLEAVNDFKRQVQKAYEKSGVVIVANGGSLITTYHLESYKKGVAREISLKK